MRPRERRESGEQDLFRSRLDQVINMDHALVKLARTIDWRFLEEKFGAVYADGSGRPPLPTRLMAGLAILKHTYNLSDEVVCEQWIENPYYQYFCRRGVFPAPAAARSLLDDQLAQPHGRGAAAGAATGEPGGRNQNWRDEARRSRPRHRRYHGAAEEHYLSD
jgi:IS5 family transposase